MTIGPAGPDSPQFKAANGYDSDTMDPMTLQSPGLFITGTDTGVGKTVVTCAIAAALRWQGVGRVGVCKPMSSGCRREREGLVHEDAEALAHFADCRLPLDVINPIRFVQPMAPAMAAALGGQSIDWSALTQALSRLDERSDALLIEGVGGLMVPLDPDKAGFTVLDLAAAVGYPVLVVARSVLGTLNHTAMTVKLLRQRGLRVAGVVMNSFDADGSGADPSITSNRVWIEQMTGVKVLAVVPRSAPGATQPAHGRIDPGVLDAVATLRWEDVLGKCQPV